MPKVLFSGCSFTANCGFYHNNRIKYHWPTLFANEFGLDPTNIAISGSSNQEIFRRTIEKIFLEKFDLVVVMWSSLSRHWIYYSENNVDDFTIVNHGSPRGFNSDKQEVRTYAKNYFTYFNNQYIDLRHWLSMILSLQETLRSLDIPMVFVKGFGNYINEFHDVEYNDGFRGPINSIKHLLDFDNRPDDYIMSKISLVKDLLQKIDKSTWVNLLSTSFRDMEVDRADDRGHPGAVTNQVIFENLRDHCMRRNLIRSSTSARIIDRNQ